VCSSTGNLLKVERLTIHAEQQQEVVDLNTANASLVVTASHRVMVRKGEQSQTMPAGGLRVGDHVIVGGNGGNDTEELVNVDKALQCLSVVDVVFAPDEPVEVYPPTRKAILSRGHGWTRTRRGRRPFKPEPDTQSNSFPDTDISAMFERSV